MFPKTSDISQKCHMTNEKVRKRIQDAAGVRDLLTRIKNRNTSQDILASRGRQKKG